MSLLILPGDVLIIVMQNLAISGLAALAETCRFLNALVHECGWADYLRSHSRPSFSLSGAQTVWGPRTQLRYHTLTDRAWSNTEFVARPLSRPWQGKLQPLLAISPSRLVVAAGNYIYSYKFAKPTNDDQAPGVLYEGSCALNEGGRSRHDITGITFVPDGGLDLTLFVGFENGLLERILLKPRSRRGREGFKVDRSPENTLRYHEGDVIESLSSAGTSLLSLSETGAAALIDTSTFSSPHPINLQARSWSSHLSMRSSTPYAVLGMSSATPLVVHSITDFELSPTPFAILYSDSEHMESDTTRPSAVYGISDAPPSAPWGASDQIIVSGWYDGYVRVHDLRSSARTASNKPNTPAALLPTLSLYDPWSFEPIYSVSCGGGSSSHIAAGSARHSVVSFWDVRAPTRGWSVHAPGNDSSPVYSIILESSRLYGATQNRPFVYDFGPGVTHKTYPRFTNAPREDGLEMQKGSSGYYVTRYYHNRINPLRAQ